MKAPPDGYATAREEPKPSSPAPRAVLPMQLQPGDRLSDATGEWEVVGAALHDSRGKMRTCGSSGWASPAAWRCGRGERMSGSA